MASEEAVPGPRVTDRALFQLIAGLRYHARTLEVRFPGDPVKESEVDAFRYCASSLEQTAGFCAVCGGRGVEHSEAFEDEPAGWFGCSMCSGSGRSRWAVQCPKCGKLDDRDMRPSAADPEVSLCSWCEGEERTELRMGEKVFGERRWYIPLGPNV